MENIVRITRARLAGSSRPAHRGTATVALYFFVLILANGMVSSLRMLKDAASTQGGSPSDITVADRLSPEDLAACPKLRIALINQVSCHYEVLAGLVHLFEPLAQQTDIYISNLTTAARGVGAWELLQPYHSNFIFLNETTRTLLNSSSAPSYDLVVLVSPEYHKADIGEWVRNMRPRMTVVYVHNVAVNLEIQELVAAVSQGGGEIKLVTLSPHTSELLESMVGQPVDWVLAAYPFSPNRSCEEVPENDLLGSCVRGFCVQGTLEGSRRGYGLLWDEMEARRSLLSTGPASALFHVTVLGKGDRRAVGVPADLQDRVTVSTDVPFTQFYESMHHSLAILPALNNVTYLKNKFTSSILSSLITGTPLVANSTFLHAYRMLSEESVFLQDDSEPEVDTMLRVVALPAAQVQAVRRGVLEVRRQVNARAAGYFDRLLKVLCAARKQW
ncbi:hypothetical protein PLESTB_001687000 [Pleodorina starrii]|uniref:Uncharacterized protein n=1 Tax=Pleodorina starrii TaxID=330485 RepID=A0A9W6F948_9CHLO|nr:hypothetical protein PLESTM_001660100 [Pleodorina starrii]GLC60883.1 hypothetical protein PLESTB_001687000 [Pleodorina starrii]GLC66666.1 hypothetical protein PLESTF_000458900 [Pleodorina starrii]